MSDDQNTRWKDKYLRSLDELEQKEKRWAELEDLLRRSIGRLAHTGYGRDRSLDRQLDRLRDAIRGGQNPVVLERLAREASEAAVQVQEEAQRQGSDTGRLMGEILGRLDLAPERKQDAERLIKKLETADSPARLQRLLAEVPPLLAGAAARPGEPAATPAADTGGGQPPRRGLLGRLLGQKDAPPDPAPAPVPAPSAPSLTTARTLERLLEGFSGSASWETRLTALRHKAAACRDGTEAERLLDETAALLAQMLRTAEAAGPDAVTVVEALPSAGEALLELLQRIEIPAHLQERLNAVKGTLGSAASPPQILVAVQAIADLLGDIRRDVQREKQELERFLEGVTSRIRTLTEHVGALESGRRISAASRSAFQQSLRHHMADIRTSIQDSDDIGQLKLAIEEGLDAIEYQMNQYVHREDQISGQAQKRIDDLNRRLHDMKHEAFLLQQQMAEQRNQALRDPLTGAFNRLAYEERIAEEYGRWKRYGGDLSLLVVDVDHFKRVNDGFGHLAGDKALKALAARLAQSVREVDTVARYGGEEFVVIMPGTTGDQAFQAAEKLRTLVAAAGFHYQQRPVSITISCGVAQLREGDDPDSLFRRADEALYAAKQGGRNQTRMEEPPSAADAALA